MENPTSEMFYKLIKKSKYKKESNTTCLVVNNEKQLDPSDHVYGLSLTFVQSVHQMGHYQTRKCICEMSLNASTHRVCIVCCH